MAGSGQPFPMSTQGSIQTSMMPSQGVASSYGQPSYTPPQPTQMSGLQHQQSFPGPAPLPASNPAQPQMVSPTKPLNAVSLCKAGQETNQELVNKLLEVFRHLKMLQLPNGTNSTKYHEGRLKIDESLKQLNILFRKLRVIYDKVSEVIVDPDENPEEVLVPLKGEPIEEKNTNTETYKFVAEDHKAIVEQLTQKNQQIKDVIDKIRTIMWEINTMIVMRKT